ncbi:hypothetical protein CEXT_111721 [Caerostris extrusa]|uniref:Uncharacterized protein n=1 Tax=Caerostris extrusa TaxID=172846 RepID=A0AAV4Q3V6_CAEEX|nr:hypothetical protein CEXT_111721 [Caerostris extrusa]
MTFPNMLVFIGDRGLYLARRILSSSPASSTPPPPPQACTAESKRFGSRKFAQRYRPKSTETRSRPTRGWRRGFSQRAIVHQTTGGRPTSHGKTGDSNRKTPGPRKTLKESGVPDRY